METRRFTDAETFFENLEEEYLRLFITDRNGIPAPLYASCYEGEHSLMMGEPAIRMKERLAAEGLTIAEGMGEPPDHLSIELELLYFLLGRSGGESPGGTAVEAADFAASTMVPWVRQFSKRLWDDSEHAERRFYHLAAALLLSVLEFIAGFDGSD